MGKMAKSFFSLLHSCFPATKCTGYKWVALLMPLNFAVQFSIEASFPQVIDFSELKLQHSYYSLNSDDWSWKLGDTALRMGFSAFNDAPEIGVFLALLKEKCQIDTVVETGTYGADTSYFFSKYFNEVHTIEIGEVYYLKAKDFFENTNVNCYLGSSEKILPQILPNLQSKRVLFYLDAHCHAYWPLLDELEEISKTHHDNCIVIIDDFKVPNRADLPYDSYNGHECSYDYVKESLNKIFSEYSYYYLIPKTTRSRAKFVAIPKLWEENLH